MFKIVMINQKYIIENLGLNSWLNWEYINDKYFFLDKIVNKATLYLI